MCAYSVQYLSFWPQSVVSLIIKQTDNNSHTWLQLSFSLHYVFHWRVLSSSTTLSLAFLCFTLSHSSLCRCVQFNSIQLNGFYWHDIWHVSPKHAPTEIDQSLNKSRCQPSLHLCLFPLAPFLSFSLCLISFPCLLLVILILTPLILTPFRLLCLLSLSFTIISLSLSLEHDMPCAYLNATAFAGLRKMKVGWVGGCSVEKGIMNGEEENDWQNLLTFLPLSLAVLPKGKDSKWVMGQFLVGPHITWTLLCFNEPGSQDYIYSNRLGLRFQNSCSGNPFNGFC